MRTIFNVVGCIALALVLMVGCVVLWFNYSSSGLPDVGALRAYAPAVHGEVPSGACRRGVSVSTVNDLKPLFPVLIAAEGKPATNVFFVRDTTRHGDYAVKIAQSMFCDAKDKNLTRAIKELRMTLHIRRKYSTEEQLAIYLNRSYFGDERWGIDAASRHYFGVSSTELTTAQGALLVGMINRPGFYSPVKHPDHALERRNGVLEEMRAEGSLSATDAAADEGMPLGLR